MLLHLMIEWFSWRLDAKFRAREFRQEFTGLTERVKKDAEMLKAKNCLRDNLETVPDRM